MPTRWTRSRSVLSGRGFLSCPVSPRRSCTASPRLEVPDDSSEAAFQENIAPAQPVGYAARMSSSALASFPALRLRRLRRTPALRALVAETRLSADQLVLPLFARPGRRIRREI